MPPYGAYLPNLKILRRIFRFPRWETTVEVIAMSDLPTGLMMALAKDEKAMLRFAGLADSTRQQVIAQARQAASREEMQAIVRSLA